MPYGTLQITDTLASQRTLIADYGEDNAYQAIARYLAAHNAITMDMVSDLAEMTTDRLRRYGGVDAVTMIRGDEYARPEAQKINAGVNVGFPLDNFFGGLQWTRKYFQTHTVFELEATVNAILVADAQRIQLELKRALFTPTNNLTYVDRLVDASAQITIPIRALLNADSTAIPADPWGNIFTPATHTHYIATAAFTAADLTALVTLVQEHYNVGTVVIYINQAQEAAVRALPGFTAYVDSRIVPTITANYAVQPGGLDMMNTYDRTIGLFAAAQISVKPWIPSGYLFAFNPMQRKPLAIRTRPGTMFSLQMVADNELYPLRAQYYEREFGVAVQERANGAILYTGGSTYTAPTLAN